MRDELIHDVQAAYDGDPAASSLDEVILAYPGMLAVTVHRVAHELHVMGVPLMPRIMSEWAHSRSGADIHPGARIGRSFFIDHATGVVVGETTTIGSNVKLYQGVTLGALSIPRDERGRVIRDTKRHPTVEDGVTDLRERDRPRRRHRPRRGQRRGRLGLRDDQRAPGLARRPAPPGHDGPLEGRRRRLRHLTGVDGGQVLNLESGCVTASVCPPSSDGRHDGRRRGDPLAWDSAAGTSG